MPYAPIWLGQGRFFETNLNRMLGELYGAGWGDSLRPLGRAGKHLRHPIRDYPSGQGIGILMATYVYRDGQMVDKATGKPMLTEEERNRPLQRPYAYGDMEGYASPIDGRWIEGRRARRYDLESNGCVEAGDIKPKGKLKNARFAKKHGLEHLLEQ